MPILDHFSPAGRLPVITGASRGLGLEMARALGKADAELISVGSDEARLRKAAEDLPSAEHHVAATKPIGAAMLERDFGRVINMASIHALWPGKAMRALGRITHRQLWGRSF